MGKSQMGGENGLKKGPWTHEEDQKLRSYIEKHGHGSWRALPKLAGLNRCGKSCRLRWTNYLRPDIKRGKFSDEEEQVIINLHAVIGNKWSSIAQHLPGRTDNEIKNFWNTHLKKKLLKVGIDPVTHRPRTDQTLISNLPNLLASATLGIPDAALELAKFQLLKNILCVLSGTPSLPVEANAIPNFGGLGGFQSSMPLMSGHVDSYQHPVEGAFPCAMEPYDFTSHQRSITNTHPPSVSASPICSNVETLINPNGFSDFSSSSSLFDSLGGLANNEEDDSYWRDIADIIN